MVLCSEQVNMENLLLRLVFNWVRISGKTEQNAKWILRGCTESIILYFILYKGDVLLLKD